MIQSTKDQTKVSSDQIEEIKKNDLPQDFFEMNQKIQSQLNLGSPKNQDPNIKTLQPTGSQVNEIRIPPTTASLKPIEPKISIRLIEPKQFNVMPQRQNELSGSNRQILQQKGDTDSNRLLEEDKSSVSFTNKQKSGNKVQYEDVLQIVFQQPKDDVQKQNSKKQIKPNFSNSNRQQLGPQKSKPQKQLNPYINESIRRQSLPLKFSKPSVSNSSLYQHYSIFKNSHKFKASVENNVLVDLQNKIIYLPAYMRIKVKKILSLQLSDLNMQLNITLILDIFYGQLPQEIIKVLMEQTSLIFQKEEPMLLHNSKNEEEGHLQTKCDNQKQLKLIKFTVRRKINVHLDADVRWTPFQVIYPIISVELPSINWTPKNPLKDQKEVTDWQICFTLMDYQNQYLKLSYDNEQTFGYYHLAPNLIRSMFNHSRVNTFQDFYLHQNLLKQRTQRQKQKMNYFEKNLSTKTLKTQSQDRLAYWFNHCYTSQQSSINGQIFAEVQSQIQIKSKNMRNTLEQLFTEENLEKSIQKYFSKSQPVTVFNMANFTIPLYKEPGFALSTIFLPLLLLSIINLAIFFQNADLHDRIASVSLLMLAFVSLIPTLRSQLPPSYQISMVEWMVYVQTYTTVLVLVRSLEILPYQAYTFEIQNQWLFIIACIITGQVIIIVLAMMARYYFFNKPKYNKQPLQIERQEQFSSHKIKWRNSEFLKELIIKGKHFFTDEELKRKWAEVKKQNQQKKQKK